MGKEAMTDALTPDECDKMRDFLNSLLRANQSARSTGNRIDITQFMQIYRDQYATVVTKNPRGVTQKQREEANQKMNGLRQYLIDHIGWRLTEIAAELKMSPGNVALYYKNLGIQREKLNRHHRREST